MRRISLPGLRAGSDRRSDSPPGTLDLVADLAVQLRDRDPRPVDDRVTEHWREFLTRMSAPGAVLAGLERIRAGAHVVVTGQQAGALTGPMLTVLKAARAVAVARELEARSGQPVVPVFWVAADDHDLGEIHHTDLVGSNGDWRRVRLDLEESRQPAAAVPVPASVAPLLESLAIDGFVPADLAQSLQPHNGDTLSTWFTRCLMSLLGSSGLVPVEPESFAAVSHDLFDRVLRNADAYDDALRDGARRLIGEGVQPPLTPDGDPPLFLIDSAGRHRLRRNDDSWNANGRSLTHEQVIELATTGTPRLSANVSLRTLLQDHALPVAAYVAGPSERLYWAQLRALHERFEVPYPVVLERPSATVVPSRTARQITKLGADWEELLLDPAAAVETEPPWSERGQELDGQLADFLEELAEQGPAYRSSLGRRAEQTRRNLRLVLNRAAELHREGEARTSARRDGVLDVLRPRGKPQDRIANVFSFWSEFGPALIDECLALPLDTDSHWLILPESSSDG